VAHRIYYLEKALDMLMNRNDTIFVTSGEIADWFVAADKTGLGDLQKALEARAEGSEERGYARTRGFHRARSSDCASATAYGVANNRRRSLQ
jgi:hypothetical protein